MLKQQKKEVIKHFDAWSTHYKKEVWSRDKFFHKMLKNQVFDAIKKANKLFILELGCGPGLYLEEFILNGHIVIGVDFSFNMLRISKNKLKEIEYNAFNLILADAEHLPFREGIFDIINCIEVLRHLPAPSKTIWKVFKEVQRTMKNQGSFLISIPNILFPLNIVSIVYYIIPRSLMRLFNKKIGFHYNQNFSFPHFPVLYNEPEDHMFNIFFIKKLINNLNLKISKLKGIFFFPACPKIFFSFIKKLDFLMGNSCWRVFAYSFFIKINHLYSKECLNI
ncbi:MAG: class I SAM-dependent methyltransferase [Candidatus Helarchaeota archaeon]